MTDSPLWREFESGDGLLLRFLRFVLAVLCLGFLLFTGVLELTWPQQLVLGLLTVLVAVWMDRSSSSYLVTLTLLLMSVYSTFRYGYWRASTTARFFHDPGSRWSMIDAFFVSMLLFAELYAVLILLLGYLQTVWPLRRTPVPLPEDPHLWPAVDVLIPTYNEPLSVVKSTAFAAMNIDWPADRLNVYLLDDGRRDEFRSFAETVGIGYMTRDDNEHAKAGNINRALLRLGSPFVAIFDSDHIPTRSFLQITVGWFLRDSKLAMLQTPHHFYSPDPFERNLDQFRAIPNEGELFYGIVQDGNDFWNATFFCGSSAVIRRAALDDVGGMATDTVTEDAHTSLRMQMKGWNTAYINIPQAAGLATERLSGHIRQRIRWARGMVQILRIDNPLFARGLSAAQRLCYFNAMTHFLYALPRLIFLTAPLIYLVLGQVNVPGYWAAILGYAIPHLVLALLTNSRIQGNHRHSFWNEIYETMLAPFILLPTMRAFISPRRGAFSVTAKGGVVNRRFFDTRIARPFLFMMGLNLLGIVLGFFRLIDVGVPFLGRFYDAGHAGTVVMNLLWVSFNMIVLGVCTGVAWESQQRRQSVRIAMTLPVETRMANGSLIRGITSDLSSGGVMMKMERDFSARSGDRIKVALPALDANVTFPAQVVEVSGNVLRAQFEQLSLQEEEALTLVLYARADTWLGWGENREPDHPLKSVGLLLRLSARGLVETARGIVRRRSRPTPSPKLATSIAPMLLLALAVTTAFASTGQPRTPSQEPPAPAQSTPADQSASSAPPDATVTARRPRRILPPQPETSAPGNFSSTLSLADLGVPDTIILRGTNARRTVYFSLPATETAKAATLKLDYHFSPGLLPALSHLKIALNGTLVTTLPVTAPATQPGPSDNVRRENNTLLQSTVTLPANLIARDNQLTFEFVGHYTNECEDPAHTALWSHIDTSSSIELAGTLNPLRDDLKMLPTPFYDAAVNQHPSIPIVFFGQPSPRALEAAGIVASWFGVVAELRPLRFPVSFGEIPQGNAIVFAENPADLPASLKAAGSPGPTIAMRTNPADPFGKVLVLTGDNADDLVSAALGLGLQRDLLSGDITRVAALKRPAPRQPDDAPRWLSTTRNTPISEIAGLNDLQTGGDADSPLRIYMRLPPDLYFGQRQSLLLHLDYRYNGIPLSPGSGMQVAMNGGYASSTPLPHNDNASAQLSTVVPIPIGDMRPFSNTLTAQFLFQLARKGKCFDSGPDSERGAILNDSYLDIRDIPHWTPLPNLELFANAGYPFTRRADLSDTSVVMPATPTTDEIETFLTMMGHFGSQTGYPVLGVSVIDSEGMKTDARKDYLVIGTVDDQPALSRLNASLPVVVDGSGIHIQDTQGFFASLQNAWWKVPSSDRVQSGQLETAGGLPDVLLEGIEWPSGSGRSLVLVALRDHGVVPNFLSVFLRNSQSSDVSQSVSVLHGRRFVSYRIGDDVYHVGTLTWFNRINLLFGEFQWLMVLGTMIVCFLLATVVRSSLRRRARHRLQGNQ